MARFFVGALQPWLVQLRQRTELLLAPVTDLETPLSPALSPEYRAWIIDRDQLLTNQTELIRAHIANIQETLAQCGQLIQLQTHQGRDPSARQPRGRAYSSPPEAGAVLFADQLVLFGSCGPAPLHTEHCDAAPTLH